MRKFNVAVVGLGATLSMVSAATAIMSTQAPVASASGATATTLPTPVQGAGLHPVFMYADTVTGSGGTVKPPGVCEMSNLFQRGQMVVWRMWGIEAATGGTDLTPTNVVTAFVKVPGEKAIPMTYGPKDPFWTAAWVVPMNYPFGTVNFSVQVTTKKAGRVPVEHGLFTQKGLAPPSQLTIVKS